MIVTAILGWLRRQPHTYARKTHGGPYSGGWPDIVGCHAGVLFCIEVKRPGGRATPLQARELDLWRRAGAVADVVTSVDDAKMLLRHVLGVSRGILTSAHVFPKLKAPK